MVLRLAAPEPHGRRGGLRHASVLGKRSVWGYSPGVHSNRARRSTHARIAAPSLRGSAPSLRGPARKGPGRGQASRGQWRPPAALEGPRDHRTEPTITGGRSSSRPGQSAAVPPPSRSGARRGPGRRPGRGVVREESGARRGLGDGGVERPGCGDGGWGMGWGGRTWMTPRERSSTERRGSWARISSADTCAGAQRRPSGERQAAPGP